MKGIKGTSYAKESFDLIGGVTIKDFLENNVFQIVMYTSAFMSLLSYAFIRFFKFNIYKIIIGVGTFGLALAFAGNDLVNFIGVPIAAWQSYMEFTTNNPDALLAHEFPMDFLGSQDDKTKLAAPTYFLFAAGIIMVLTLWFSKKAKRVVKTELDLSNQGNIDERFEPNFLSRGLVRLATNSANLFSKITPDSLNNKIEERFRVPETFTKEIAKEDKPSFDVIRASVNLMVAGILISIATSYKLPLSTTYVTFMVAMGTSLSDRAWGSDSAVYRVAGVLNVIAGWFGTAIIAFTAAGTIAYLINISQLMIAVLIFFAILLLVRNYIKGKNKTNNGVIEESLVEQRQALFEEIEIGSIMEGRVKNITDFGVFVDLGGIDGLLHITDLSWGRVNHPSEMIELNDDITVKVIEYDSERKRVSLGLKQLTPHPWEEVEVKYPIGSIVKGTIVSLTNYGAFIEIEEGVEGLVHVSEMSWVSKMQNPNKYVEQNQEVEVMVLEIDPDKKRLSLGLKQCLDNPWEDFAQKNPIGTKLSGKIQNITDFGLFVKVSDELDGLVHMSDVDWRKSGADAIKDFEVDQEIETIIIDIDPSKERISLGIKQLDDDPMESLDQIKKGSVVTCTVVSSQAAGIDVEIGDKVPAFIKRSDLSKDKSEQIPERFETGHKVDAKVTQIDQKNRKVTLSVKAREIEEETKAMAEYGSSDSGASLGDILGAALKQKEEDQNAEK